MINITNKKARRRWQQEFNRQMIVLENIFAKEIRPVLNRAYMNSAKLVSQGELDINSTVDALTPRMINRIFKHYRRTATVFSRKAFKIIESSKSMDVPDIKTPKDEFWRAMNLWMTMEAGDQISKINTTTKNNINAVIQKGLNESIGNIAIAKALRKNGFIVNRSRSLKIAKTETHTAAVKAVDESVRSTRIEMEKEWVSSKDDRTRTFGKGSQFEHFLAFPNGPDGERVSHNEKKKKTGQSLRLPGDPNGSAGNIILCR